MIPGASPSPSPPPSSSSSSSSMSAAVRRPRVGAGAGAGAGWRVVRVESGAGPAWRKKTAASVSWPGHVASRRTVSAGIASAARSVKGNAGVDVGSSAGHGWRGRKESSGKGYGDVDDSTVDLTLVHVGDGMLGILLIVEQNVGGAAVCAD